MKGKIVIPSQRIIAVLADKCTHQNVSFFKSHEKELIESRTRLFLIPSYNHHLDSSCGLYKRIKKNAYRLISSVEYNFVKEMKLILSQINNNKPKGGRPIKVPTVEGMKKVLDLTPETKITKKYLPFNYNKMNDEDKLIYRLFALYRIFIKDILESFKEIYSKKHLSSKRRYITERILDRYWIVRWVNKPVGVIPIQFKSAIRNNFSP